MLRVFLPVALAGVFASSLAAAADRTCQRDVVATRSDLIKNVVKLERVRSSAAKQQCNAYRQYAQVVDRARKTFERCNTDQQLDKDVSGLQDAMTDVTAVIESRCTDE